MKDKCEIWQIKTNFLQFLMQNLIQKPVFKIFLVFFYAEFKSFFRFELSRAVREIF